jgi:hypothetical protein
VGWDASPRGERGYTLEEANGVHPYTPIAIGDTPDAVGDMLQKAIDFTKKYTDVLEQRLVTMFAWNEIGEGATLLPRVREGGIMDLSYLQAVARVIKAQAPS